MAIVLNNQKRLNCVRVISKQDTAIDWAKETDQEPTGTTEEDWERYREDPVRNEDAIKYKQDMSPTVFVCNFELDGKEAAAIKNSMIKSIDKDTKDPVVQFGSWAYTVVRMVLKEIENPPNVENVIVLKKDSRGYVDNRTMSLLERAGLVPEIFSHYTMLTKDEHKANAKN